MSGRRELETCTFLIRVLGLVQPGFGSLRPILPVMATGGGGKVGPSLDTSII